MPLADLIKNINNANIQSPPDGDDSSQALPQYIKKINNIQHETM